ncbi:MAG: C-GCAxxG-C-C family protein [Treponema sp.]|jgi:C_GCAxxG_C_C family probable redox protein|nr:C-GCAxxG-C-C family protein [Treponema sp.]
MQRRSPEEARRKAMELFHAGYNCAQSTFGAFCSELGLDFDTGMRMAQPLGAGMSRMRETCGGVSGALMALGLAEGSSDTADAGAKTRSYNDGQEFAAQFREKHGTLVCRELLGLTPMGQTELAEKQQIPVTHLVEDPQSSARTAAYYESRPCEEIVGDAAALLQELLNSKAKPVT